MDGSGLQRGTDHTVQPCRSGVSGIAEHHLLQRGVDQQLPLHALLIGGGQLGDGDEQRAGAVGAGEALQSGGHHGGGTGGVEVDDVHIQRRQGGHGLSHRVGDVVELQIQKDAVAPAADLPDDGGTLGVKQLHPHLDEGLFLCEAVQKSQRFLPAVEVQCNDNVFTHDVLLL